MTPSPLDKQALSDYLAMQRGLSRDYWHEILRSRAHAWRISAVCAATALVSLASILALLPLKEPPRIHVVRVDAASGNIEHVSQLSEPLESYGERLDRYFVHRYVQNCESYDWYLIQNFYNTCGLLSAPPVQRQYRDKFEGEQALDKVLGKQQRIVVDAQPPVLGERQTATVRFTTRKEPVGREGDGTPEHWIATLAYHYVNVDIRSAEALSNPLGFQVLSYRVDPEIW